MSIDLVRVDDRLIHGQVVVGWTRALGATRIIVVDDALRGEPWEQELYALGVPPGIDVLFASVAEAAPQMAAWGADERATIVLVPDVATVMRLAEGAGPLRAVNLGGIHDAAGRTERLTYVYLSSDEADQLCRLAASGIDVRAQDVPGGRAVTLDDLL